MSSSILFKSSHSSLWMQENKVEAVAVLGFAKSQDCKVILIRKFVVLLGILQNGCTECEHGTQCCCNVYYGWLVLQSTQLLMKFSNVFLAQPRHRNSQGNTH